MILALPLSVLVLVFFTISVLISNYRHAAR
jgi:hypothetical protein